MNNLLTQLAALIGSIFLVSSVSASNAKFEACRTKLIQAQKLDLLYDLDWKSPKEPKVVVGKTFFSIPIDAKEGFAETVNCFLMAGENKCVNFDIRHWQAGKAVARFSNCRLKMN